MNNSEQNSCSIPCNLCGSKVIEELSLIDRNRNYLRTVICKKCGLVWSDPRPENVRKYYENDYRLHYKSSFTPKLKHILRYGNIALIRFEKFKEYIQNRDTVLDVGSGGSELVYLLKKKGYLAEGIEPNKGYAEYAAKEYGIKIHNAFIEDIDLKEKQYDVITTWHVLEHTEDPFNYLLMLKKLLKNQGTLIIELPNVEVVSHAAANRFHLAHLYNFNHRTLENICIKAGYRVIKANVPQDRGLIFMVCKKNSLECMKQTSSDWSIPENCQHIMNITRKHTNFRYYTSYYPYHELFNKIQKKLNELKAIKGFSRGKDILDTLFI